jgi:cell wall-associated NlpC family hydrolase
LHLCKSTVGCVAAALFFLIGSINSAVADQTTKPPEPVESQSPEIPETTQPVKQSLTTKTLDTSPAPPSAKPVADDERIIVIHVGPDGKPLEPARAERKPAHSVTPAKPQSHDQKVAAALAKRKALAKKALSYRGAPYVWGGSSVTGFDCSGFTQYLYKQQGISLPHKASQQFQTGKPVAKSDLKAGDLVFFNTTGPLSHVGMFIGEGKFVHAANPRRGVQVDMLNRGYYAKHYAGARRYR